MSESPSGKREGFQDDTTHTKKGPLLLTQPGLLPQPTQRCRLRKSREPQLLHKFIGGHKQLVAGLSGLVTCLQSNSIGTNFGGLLFKLRVRGLFRFPFVPFRAPVDWLAPGRCGRGIHQFRGDGNPRPAACQPGSPAILRPLGSGKKFQTLLGIVEKLGRFHIAFVFFSVLLSNSSGVFHAVSVAHQVMGFFVCATFQPHSKEAEKLRRLGAVAPKKPLGDKEISAIAQGFLQEPFRWKISF